MLIEFTEHAVQKIKERKLELRHILETIKHPERIERIEDKCYAYRTIGKRLFKVVYLKETNIRVVTAYWKG